MLSSLQFNEKLNFVDWIGSSNDSKLLIISIKYCTKVVLCHFKPLVALVVIRGYLSYCGRYSGCIVRVCLPLPQKYKHLISVGIFFLRRNFLIFENIWIILFLDSHNLWPWLCGTRRYLSWQKQYCPGYTAFHYAIIFDIKQKWIN